MRSRHLLANIVGLGLALLSTDVFSDGTSKNQADQEICEKAAAKYILCVEEKLGKEVADQARITQKQGTAACIRDDKTQAMYQQCLPKQDCDEFLKCLENYARKTGSDPAIGATRKEQCANHVRIGARGIALQLVIFSEDREGDSKRAGQSCILDDSKNVDSCLSEVERQTLAKYGQQRQKDCESWKPELAACILHLQGATDCKPDEYPFWREPIEEGESGPPIVWSFEAKQRKYEQSQMAWLDDGILVVLDAMGIRCIQNGKELWRAQTKGNDLLAFGGHISTYRVEGGLVILDGKTGKQKASVLADQKIRGVVPIGNDKLLVLAGDGSLYRIEPAACQGRLKGCVRSAGTLPKDDVPYMPYFAQLAEDTLVVADTNLIRFYDRKRMPMFSIETVGIDGTHIFSANDMDLFSVIGKHHLAVQDTLGVALLDIRGCVGAGNRLFLPFGVYLPNFRAGGRPKDCNDCVIPPKGCLVAYREAVRASLKGLVTVEEGGVVFNNENENQTHLLMVDGGGWKKNTMGQGLAAGDKKHIYTVSFGLDDESPISLLALWRDSGKTAWQTILSSSKENIDEYSDKGVVVRGKWLAARVGNRIYVMDLGSAGNKQGPQ